MYFFGSAKIGRLIFLISLTVHARFKLFFLGGIWSVCPDFSDYVYQYQDENHYAVTYDLFSIKRIFWVFPFLSPVIDIGIENWIIKNKSWATIHYKATKTGKRHSRSSDLVNSNIKIDFFKSCLVGELAKVWHCIYKTYCLQMTNWKKNQR